MRCVLLSLSFLALAASPAFALWAPVPLEILVDESDMVVAGKVTKVQNGVFAVNGRNYDVAVVEVASILKTSPRLGRPMEIKIAQPGAGGLAVSTDIQFHVGQQGVWLLRKDPERDVYWAKHPFQFQDAKKQKELADLVAVRSKLPGGRAVNGLMARAELIEHKLAKGAVSYEVRISLLNTSDRPITLCDYVGNQPLQVQWTGPNGNMLKSHHYDWLEAARLRGITKAEFETIPAQGVRFIGPRSKDYGIVFQAAAQNSANVVEAGVHRVVVGYANNDSGKQFGLQNVWQGNVNANEVVFKVR